MNVGTLNADRRQSMIRAALSTTVDPATKAHGEAKVEYGLSSNRTHRAAKGS